VRWWLGKRAGRRAPASRGWPAETSQQEFLGVFFP
jgi:hypothetical protein